MDAVITQENGAYFRTLTKQVAGAERIDRQRIYPKKETILLTESDQNGKRIFFLFFFEIEDGKARHATFYFILFFSWRDSCC